MQVKLVSALAKKPTGQFAVQAPFMRKKGQQTPLRLHERWPIRRQLSLHAVKKRKKIMLTCEKLGRSGTRQKFDVNQNCMVFKLYLRKQFASVSRTAMLVAALQIWQSLLVAMFNTDGLTFSSNGKLCDCMKLLWTSYISWICAYLTTLEAFVLYLTAIEKCWNKSRAPYIVSFPDHTLC